MRLLSWWFDGDAGRPWWVIGGGRGGERTGLELDSRMVLVFSEDRIKMESSMGGRGTGRERGLWGWSEPRRVVLLPCKAY